jgi:hypothetical protein
VRDSQRAIFLLLLDLSAHRRCALCERELLKNKIHGSKFYENIYDNCDVKYDKPAPAPRKLR